MQRIFSVIIVILLALPMGYTMYSLYFSLSHDSGKLHIIYKAIHTPSDIQLLDGPIVAPILYTSVISLKTLPTKKKKEAFISILLPSILLAKRKISKERETLKRILALPTRSESEQKIIDKYKKIFRLKDETLIPQKLVTHAPSVVIAQAAIESGWGSSRFFTQANNLFGVWSFKKSDNRIAAGQTRSGKTIYLKKYKTLEGSVYDYFQTLSKVGSYAKFREARAANENPLELIKYLKSYSEMGAIYTQQLKTLIEKNDLQKYDDYRLP
ncbi:glucosaminidase domain-containing protein [Sulfurospirillum sp. 1612]|uniref:glucosaminidase domain-containing protein n=1 Tax=Sulfurospirillum sp. 1612 TaxID=3094835 RepID=UPI002F92C18C